MATDIHQVSSASPPSYDGASSDASRKDDITKKEAVVDVEGNDNDGESDKIPKDRAEATELTPLEALKWNVDGDQSPCE